MKDFLTGGELAALFDLNIQTLHYYESIGIFTPVRRRDHSGERIYRFDQIYRLATILFLKRLGYPLARIKADLESRDPAWSLARMREQSAELATRAAELLRIKDAIDRKIGFVGGNTAALDPDSVRVRHFGPRYYLPIGVEERLYRSDDFYFYPTVVFYEGERRRFGALIPEGMPDLPDRQSERVTIPEGTYLTGYHTGPYERIGATFLRLRGEAERRGLMLADPDSSIDINIIDQFVERDPARYVTEVQMALRVEGA